MTDSVKSFSAENLFQSCIGICKVQHRNGQITDEAKHRLAECSSVFRPTLQGITVEEFAALRDAATDDAGKAALADSILEQMGIVDA